VSDRPTNRRRLAVDRQQLLILLAAAVMTGSFFLFVLWPKQKELSALDSAVTRERGLVKQKVRTSREGVYVTARIAGLRKSQGGLDRRLPTEPALAEYLTALAERLDSEPLVRHEVCRAPGEGAGSVPAAIIRLRLAGPFDAVYRALAKIEGIERLTRLARLVLRQGDAPGNVQAQAEILVYHVPDPVAEDEQTSAWRQPRGQTMEVTNG